MANTITSTNMNLPVPVVSVDPGPDWASNLVLCLNSIDEHDHTSGKGVAIPISSLTMNQDLTFLGYRALALKAVNFSSQGATLSSNADSLYVVGSDLWFNNGGATPVQITNGASVNVSGQVGFVGLPSGTASASFVAASSTFVFQSATSTSAYVDCSSILIRNLSASSYALTLNPPAAMASNYTLTLCVPPAATSFVTLDSSGNFGAATALLGALTTSNLSASAGIVGTQLANATITTTQISATAGIVGTQLANATITTTQISATAGITGAQHASNCNFPGDAVQENARNVVVSTTNAATSFSIASGIVNADSSVALNNGISIGGHPGTGTYYVNWTTAFASTPVVVVAPYTGDSIGAGSYSASTTGCTVHVFQLSGAGIDRPFTILAIGPR